jgi:lysophospholipase L1-like esterase
MYRHLLATALFSLVACGACHTDSVVDATPTPPSPHPMSWTSDVLTIALYGDSNTDNGYSENPIALVARASVNTSHDPTQLSGMLERAWMGGAELKVMNRAVGGTNSQDMAAIFQPDADFVYVSTGTNDCRHGLTYGPTVTNLTAAIDRWIASGRAPRRFILTTIPPTPDDTRCKTNLETPLIRDLARARGVTLLDLSAHTSADDGLTWANDSLSIAPPRNVHYRKAVREWIAAQILADMAH